MAYETTVDRFFLVVRKEEPCTYPAPQPLEAAAPLLQLFPGYLAAPDESVLDTPP